MKLLLVISLLLLSSCSKSPDVEFNDVAHINNLLQRVYVEDNQLKIK